MTSGFTGKRIGLAVKLNALSICLILACSAGITLFYIPNEIDCRHKMLLNKARIFAALAAESMQHGENPGARTSAETALHAISGDPDIAYASIVDEQGRRLGVFSKTGNGMPPEIFHSDAIEGSDISYGEISGSANGGNYIDVSAPLRAGKDKTFIGHLRLGLNMEETAKDIRRFILSGALVTLIVICVGAAVTVFATSKIVSPLRAVEKAAIGVAEGNLDQSVDAGGNDELADVASAFNTMTAKLRAYHDQVVDYTSDILDSNRKMMAEILERKKIEEQLTCKNDQVRQILDRIGEAVITADGKGGVISLNRSAEKITGWSQEAAEGRPLYHVFRAFEESTRKPIGVRENQEGSGGAAEGKFILLSRDGAEHEITANIVPVCGVEGRTTGIICIFKNSMPI